MKPAVERPNKETVRMPLGSTLNCSRCHKAIPEENSTYREMVPYNCACGADLRTLIIYYRGTNYAGLSTIN